MKRLLLHARRLAFAHPLTGERAELESPLPADMRRFAETRPCATTLIVFDWDGTLMDSTGGIAESHPGGGRDLGLPVPGARNAPAT